MDINRVVMQRVEWYALEDFSPLQYQAISFKTLISAVVVFRNDSGGSISSQRCQTKSLFFPSFSYSTI